MIEALGGGPENALENICTVFHCRSLPNARFPLWRSTRTALLVHVFKWLRVGGSDSRDRATSIATSSGPILLSITFIPHDQQL